METPEKQSKENVKKSSSIRTNTKENLTWDLDKLNSIREELLHMTKRYSELEEKIEKLEDGEEVEYDGDVDEVIYNFQCERDEIGDKMATFPKILDEFDHLDFEMAKILVEAPEIGGMLYYVNNVDKFGGVNSDNIEERKSLLRKIIDKGDFQELGNEEIDAFDWCFDNEVALHILNKNADAIDNLKNLWNWWLSTLFTDLLAFFGCMGKFHWLHEDVLDIILGIWENTKDKGVKQKIWYYLLLNLDSFDCISDEEKREIREMFDRK